MLHEDSSESVSVGPDMFVISQEQIREDGPHSVTNDGARSVTNETESEGTDDKALKSPVAVRSSGARHILVKDTAPQTYVRASTFCSFRPDL